ncbi:MAG: FecR family protein [Marinilabiliaceae bacterium]|nr:FecR family protein [Marinilabiliaceae bacterium]
MIRRTLAQASLLILIITVLHEQGPQCYIANDSIHKVSLPDGSVIYLNKNSHLFYKPAEWHKRRNVRLEGEAFFIVEKGPVFQVKTALADVKVLGTSFNVYVSDTTYSLHCYTGKVSVHSNTNHFHQLIFPGEAAILMNNEWNHTPVSIQNHPEWLKLPLKFSQESLNNVFTTIEKRFKVSIKLPDYSDKYFTGTISSNNLDSVMQVVCSPMNLTY